LRRTGSCTRRRVVPTSSLREGPDFGFAGGRLREWSGVLPDAPVRRTRRTLTE
jgi:hypothetical protein